MSKRILMLTDADSFWTRRYIEHVLLPEGHQVLIFPIWGDQGTNARFYRQHGIKVYQDRHRMPLIRHIPRLRMWVRIWLNGRSLRKLGPFDIIHNHYLSRRDLALGQALARAFPKARWVCTFWGSDLLRASNKALKEMGPYLRRCHAVTVQSTLHEEMLQKIYGEAVTRKTVLVQFGVTVFKEIDKIEETMTKAQCKAHFGIGQEQRVVCVGSNASPAQHQPEVLSALAQIPPEELSTITIVLQMTYGGHDEDYVRQVEEKAAALPCRCVFLREFLDGEESAKLRKAADVFILAVQTDAFSASMREYLYAGAQVITGDWLHYPQLLESRIQTTRFADYDELPSLLVSVLMSPIPHQERERRRMELGSRYSWEAVRRDWLATYT